MGWAIFWAIVYKLICLPWSSAIAVGQRDEDLGDQMCEKICPMASKNSQKVAPKTIFLQNKYVHLFP
jgi:hypothetical protein